MFRDVIMNEKSEQFEAEDARKEVDEECFLDTIDEHTEES